MSLRMKLVKQSQQDIKHRHRSGKPRRNVGSSSFEDVLEMGNQGQHGKAGFNQHSLIPSTFGTDFDVLWNAIDIACPAISQHNGLTDEGNRQRVEVFVGGVERIPLPSDDFTPLVEQPAQLDAYRPATFVAAFLAHLPQAATFADRKQHLDGIGVQHGKEARISQQTVEPASMELECSAQARPIRQTDKQDLVIAFQPAVEGAETAALECIQDADGHQFTPIQLGLRMFAHILHSVIDIAKDQDDNLYCGHGSAPFVSFPTYIVSLDHDLFNSTSLPLATSTIGYIDRRSDVNQIEE